MRKLIVAGNWKMNLGIEEGTKLAADINIYLTKKHLPGNKRVIISPPFTHLYSISKVITPSLITLSAQNCASTENGAYTGEISAKMLQELGVKNVILGHSERRQYFKEDSEILLKKIKMALKYNLEIIFCVGESVEQRENNTYFNIIESQIKETLFNLNENEIKNVIIAYEPVWAIGTGKTATPDQAQEMHEFIRNLIKKKFGKEISEQLSILYGGSCKPGNAKEIFGKKDVDGGLIGGAALKAIDFEKIIDAI
jgi:triosephosphate isomerase